MNIGKQCHWSTITLGHLQTTHDCFATAEMSSSERLSGLQNLKYLLSDSLENKFQTFDIHLSFETQWSSNKGPSDRY